MRKKRILIFAFILGLFVFALFIILRGQPVYHMGPATAKNIQYPYSESGKVYFYTGHGFAKYDANVQKTFTLSDFMSFPQIRHMNISSKGAIYQTAETYPTDSLYFYLKSRGLPTDRFYWWLTEFETGKTSLIAEKEGFSNEIVSVGWAGSNLLVARQADDYALDKKFELYKKTSGDLELLKTNRGETFEEILWANEQKVIFSSKKAGQSKVGLNIFNFSTKNISTLPSAVGGAGMVASPGGNFLAYQISGQGEATTDETPLEGLYIYRVGSEQPQLVLKDFAGTIIPSATDSFLVSGNTGQDDEITAILDAGGQLKKFKVQTKSDTAPNIFSLGPLDQNLDKIVAVDDQENLYLLSKGEEPTGQLEAVPAQAKDMSVPAYDIAYFESSNGFSILIKQNPFKQNLGLALKALQDTGVDTNQHEIIANPVRTLKIVR